VAGAARDAQPFENGKDADDFLQRGIPMKWFSVWGVLALGAVVALFAQNPGLQRTILQRKDISIPGREAVVAKVELAPGSFAGRHTHPGEEISYVLEGQGEILIDGEPALKIKAGDSVIISSGVVHDAHNTGTQPLKLVGVYVVDKSKPLATPAH
jgi:quercetin dioxygenase-like cupin family protein